MDEPFVGRATELAALHRQFELAGDGHGHPVLITGPEGIGKTMLVRRCLETWPACVLSVSGDPDETALPAGLLAQLAQQAAVPAARELAGLLATGPVSPLSAGSLLLVMFQDLDTGWPLVVVVDDAQWADELSLRALSFACRRLQADPVLCLVVTRPDGVAALPGGLVRMVRERGIRLDLGGFGPADVTALAERSGAGRLPALAARRLHEHTAGVPLHIKELLHDLPGEVLRAPGAALPAPRSLELLVLSRLATCSPDTERLVVAAAVLGSGCPLTDAATLAGLADPLPALQQAISQRLLQDLGTGDRRCVFPHTLIGAAVHRDIGVSRRAALHRAAAQLTSGVAALAHRAAGCGGGDPELAADLDRQASRELAAGRPTEAAGHLLTAAQVSGRGPARDRRLVTAVGMLVDLGDAARARGYTEEITALPPSAQRSLILGRLALLNGQHRQAEQCLTDAWAAPGPDAPGPGPADRESAAVAACELALVLIGQHRPADAAAWAQRANAAATTGFTRACSCAVHGGSLTAAGRTDEARELLETGIAQIEDGPGRGLIRASLAATLLRADHISAAASHLDAAIGADGPDRLPKAQLLEASLLRVMAGYRGGEWDQAAAAAERLVALIDDLDLGWLLARAHLAAVYVAAGRGQWQCAIGHADAASRQMGPELGAGPVEMADAQVAIAVAHDDPAGVLAAAGPVLANLSRFADLEPSRLAFWPSYAHALARSGQPGEADRTLRGFEDLAVARGRRSAMAAAGRVRGSLEAMRQDTGAARISFEKSVDQVTGLGMPFEEALTRLEYGRFLRRQGQRRAALRELSPARALFAGLGAQPFLARCDAELGVEQAGAASPRQPPLTARQLAVATAVASGKSNREVAAELYVSVKTVEFHVSQILIRLGVDSRTEIAGALGRGRSGRPG